MINPKKQGSATGTGMAWPGLIVLLGSICAYWLAQNELTTSRPKPSSNYQVPPPAGPSLLGAAYSRMWEDPITTTYQHWTRHQPTAQPVDPIGRVIEVLQGAPIESMETTTVKDWFGELVDRNTLCLPILVGGGPYAEDKETRIRTRYAVVTALAHAGYQLKYADRMSYAVVKAKVRQLKDWSEEEFVIPVKLYRSLNVDQQILVLWINESQLGVRPLLGLHRLTDGLLGGVKIRDNLTFRVIGPSSSDTLDSICQEVYWLADPDYHRKFEQLRANYEKRKQQHLKLTLNEFGFVEEWFRNPEGPLIEKGKLTVILSPRATVNYKRFNVSRDHTFTESDHFRIVRTIGNDHLLVRHAIQPELETRGAWPEAGKREVMVLLTEQDTFYGRGIVNEFEDVFRNSNSEDLPDSDVAEIPLRVLKYFRGTDGQTAAETEQKNLPKESKSNPSNDLYGLPTPETTMRLPQGESQYDYLRRLKDEIQRLEERQKVTAIGVVASDVYDKLLILRALRPYFPDTVFFTTDLDAIYAHPQELHHTRNLIIASHYGLRLNADFYDAFSRKVLANGDAVSTTKFNMLPFRDSYQTSEHLAARIAIGDVQIRNVLQQIVPEDFRSDSVFDMASKLWDHEHKHSSVLKPLITTVGNNGFRQLEYPAPDYRSSIARQHAETSGNDKHQQATRAQSVPAADAHREIADYHENGSRLSLQPEPDMSARFLRAPLTVLLIALGIVGFVTWDHRETIAETLKGTAQAGGAGETSVSDGIPDLQAKFLSATLPVTVLLLIWASIEGIFGLEQIRLDGTSVMPRVLIQILIGLSAALTLVQFSRKICGMQQRWKQKTQARGDEAGILEKVSHDAALPQLERGIVWNTFVFSFYLLLLAAVVLYFPAMVKLLLTVGITGLLAGVVWLKFGGALREKSGRQQQEYFALFRRNTCHVILSAFAMGLGALVVLMTLLIFTELYAPNFVTASGWRPYFMSRGGVTTWALDFSSMAFAHTMICFLFTAILFGHEWSRGFTRYLREKSWEFDTQQRKSAENQVDSLFLIGDATLVSMKFTPWLLVFILGLLLAYHPTISPVPIPAGILILLSLAIAILVASTISVSQVTHQFREDVLVNLQGQLYGLRCKKENRSGTPESGDGDKTGEQEGEEQGQVEIDEAVEETTGGTKANPR